MGNENIYKYIIKYLWMKLTLRMWRAGYGRKWMQDIIELI